MDFVPHDARAADLSSPWDVVWYAPDDHGAPEDSDAGRVIVAMAGVHQLWWFDPLARTTGVYAGTTVEGLRDGPLPESFLAQPSGLAVTPDGGRLWFVDAETSALRYIEKDIVYTAVGTGLFDFGHRDGPGTQALMQHPLGVTVLSDGFADAFGDVYEWQGVRGA